MKKIVKLSLATSLVLVGSLHAENLSEAFTNSKVKGEIKAEYSDSNFLGKAKSDDIIGIGGSLGLKTASYYGFTAGVTFQASSIINDDNNSDVFVNDLDASGAVLSESYIDYTISNTNLKVGRQFMYTPLVSTAIDGKSSESILKDSFEAYVLTNTDIPNTTLSAAYINKYQGKTDGLGDTSDFDKFQDGAYSIYAKNTSLENLTLQAQYLNEDGETKTSDKDVLYFQADYTIAGHNLSFQALSSTDKTQASNAQDGELFGLRAMGPLGIWKLGYIIAYNSSTDKNAPVYTGIGTGTSDTPFTAMPVHGGGVPTRADTDTIVGGIIAPIADATVISYAGKSSSKSHALGDVDAIGAMVIYPISKNFLLKINYEHVETENIINPAGIVDEDTDTTRIYLSYKF